MSADSISHSQARRLVRAELEFLHSSTSISQLTRAERLKRLEMSQSILAKIDERPHDAPLAPKEWAFVRQILEEAGGSVDEDDDEPGAF